MRRKPKGDRNMSNIVQMNPDEPREVGITFNEEKVQLLRDTICKGATPNELSLFVHACKRLGLDPFMRQVHAVKRWDSDLNRESMTIQTGIDGYRLIADRSGKYMPGKEATFVYDEKKQLISATAYVKKLGPDDVWHEVAATVYYDEYVAKKKDGSPIKMWKEKPHIMLAKCAEAQALRRAFPAELSGIYTNDEMEHADTPQVVNKSTGEISSSKEYISSAHAKILEDLIGEDEEYRQNLYKYFKALSFENVPIEKYASLLSAIRKHNEENVSKSAIIDINKEELPF